MIVLRFALSLCFALCLAYSSAYADTRYAIVGTGGVTGVYYPAGGSVCRMVNRLRLQHGIRCAVESTQGSIYNLSKVRERDLDLAVVQSDWHYHAYHGSGQFKDNGPDRQLRSLFSLHAEPFTVVARRDANIQEFTDLKGKRVNIGNPGSGQRATMEVLMEHLKWENADFSEVFEYRSYDQARELCKGTFDAMIFVAGHPSASIKEATSGCDSVVVPVRGKEIDQLVSAHEYYRRVEIPGGMYRGNDTNVETFGVGATFVTHAALDEDVIYEVVKAVFEHFEEFRQLHPAFHDLNKKEMLSGGLSAPLHPGAERYYREARMQ